MTPSITQWLAAIALVVCGSTTWAAAPLHTNQAPGYYRWMLGDIEVTALSDGTFDLDTRVALTNVGEVPVGKLLEKDFEGTSIPVSVNAYLINTGQRLILVDTGAAQHFGPSLGKLLENLVAAGYRPEQVDDVLLTHMHPDHVGGLSLDGSCVFPNAVVHVEEREAAFWTSAAEKASAPANRVSFFETAVTSVAPYIEKGAFRPFAAPTRLFEGISAAPAPGHTPGHTVYVVESKGQKLMIWGDVMELDSIQFEAPGVTIVFDQDAAAAAALRPDAYADAAAGRYWLAVAHLPFPGIGHVRADRDGHSWVPVRYDRVR